MSGPCLAQLAERFDVHPNETNQWKSQLLERAEEAFDGGTEKPGGSQTPNLKELPAGGLRSAGAGRGVEPPDPRAG